MIRKILVASILSVVASSAFATGQTWSFGTNQPAYHNGNSIHVNTDGINMSVTAWASTGEGCLPNGYGSAAGDPDPCITKANLRNYNGGLGIINQDEQALDYGDFNVVNGHLVANTHRPDDSQGQHAIDNLQNRGSNPHPQDPDYDFEMVLLTFDHAVNITEIGKSYHFQDADFSMLAYNGNSPFSSIEGDTWANLVGTGGWDVVDNGALKTTGVIDNGASPIFSQHWLVGAYNAVFGGSHSEHNDAFKLNGLSTVKYVPPTDNNQVNAPASLAFLVIGMGLLGFRKKMFLNKK